MTAGRFPWQARSAPMLWALLLAGVAACGGPSVGPNAVLIVLDTTRSDALSCYGSRFVRTPALDGLAARGVRFAEAETQNPFTLGSVATVLTSLPPAVHAMRGNSGYRLPAGAVTLAEAFRDAGYATAAFVSAVPLSRDGGLDQGFEIYDDDFSAGFPIYDEQFDPIRESLQGAERRGDETTDRALAWLETDRPKDRPFFLMIHLFDPHQPYDPPPPFASEYGPLRYAGEVAFADAQVGRVLQALEAGRLLSRTFVSVIADHGEAFGEHSEVGHGFLLYHTTLRVPWIVAGPGVGPAVVEGTAFLEDVAPTLLGLCGAASPEPFEGMDLSARLTDTASPGGRLADRGVYIDTYFPRVQHRWSELLGWRKGPYKLIRGPRSELFDLRADPEETVNLIDARADLAREMAGELDAYLERAASRRLATAVEAPDAETVERLKSLGYVGGGTGEEFPEAGWDLGLPDPRDAVVAWNHRQESRALYRFSLVRLSAGDFKGALRWADSSLAHDSENLDALLVRSQSLNALSREGESLAGYRTLLAARPQDAGAWAGYGMALDKTGRGKEARDAYRKALEIDPDHPQANVAVGYMLVREGKLEEALPHYETVRRVDPGNVDLVVQLARVYVQLQRMEEGRAVLEDCHRRDPRHRETLLLLGLLKLELGDTAGAKEILQEYLRHHPNAADAAEVRKTLESIAN